MEADQVQFTDEEQAEIDRFTAQFGSDVNAVNEHGVLLLHQAACNCGVAVTKYLISKAVDIETKDGDGCTPFHYAAYGENIEVMKFLVSAGARVDAKNKDGQTPLGLAKKLMKIGTVEYLETIPTSEPFNPFWKKGGDVDIAGDVEIKYHLGNSDGVNIKYVESTGSGNPATLDIYVKMVDDQIDTTSAELVTAINNSAFWGKSVSQELIAELAQENAGGRYYDATVPPVAIARVPANRDGTDCVKIANAVAKSGGDVP